MKLKLTQKPYYKKYFKKITVIHKNYNIDFLQKSYRFLLSNKNYLIVSKDIKNLTKILKNKDVKIMKSVRNGKLIVYYNSDDIEQLIPDHFTITEKYKPINDEQITLQTNNNSLDVRNILYYKKYRYKIDLKLSNSYGEHNIDIFNNLKIEIAELHNQSDLRSTYRFSPMVRLYISCSEEDLFYIQLKYGDKILKIHEAVLTSEVK